jgi:hypothetical protein
MMLLETDTHRRLGFVVACLKCGSTRRTHLSGTGHLTAPECPACGYLGWRELPEPARRRVDGPCRGRRG